MLNIRLLDAALQILRLPVLAVPSPTTDDPEYLRKKRQALTFNMMTHFSRIILSKPAARGVCIEI
jgi:hypothetical protein